VRGHWCEGLESSPSHPEIFPKIYQLKLPADNDPVGPAGRDDELFELQRMVQDNEEALKRAKNMISELKRHLSKEDPASPARKTKKKRAV